jgi:hypothetical protein
MPTNRTSRQVIPISSRYRDCSGLRWMPKLPMAANLADLHPPVVQELTDDLPNFHDAKLLIRCINRSARLAMKHQRPCPASSYHLSTLLWGLGSENSGHDIDESLDVEDKLLLGHAFSRSWARAEGRRVAGKSAPRSDSTGEGQTHSPRS